MSQKILANINIGQFKIYATYHILEKYGMYGDLSHQITDKLIQQV